MSDIIKWSIILCVSYGCTIFVPYSEVGKKSKNIEFNFDKPEWVKQKKILLIKLI